MRELIYSKKFYIALGAFLILILALFGLEPTEQVKQAYENFMEIMSALN